MLNRPAIFSCKHVLRNSVYLSYLEYQDQYNLKVNFNIISALHSFSVYMQKRLLVKKLKKPTLIMYD